MIAKMTMSRLLWVHTDTVFAAVRRYRKIFTATIAIPVNAVRSAVNMFPIPMKYMIHTAIQDTFAITAVMSIIPAATDAAVITQIHRSFRLPMMIMFVMTAVTDIIPAVIYATSITVTTI